MSASIYLRTLANILLNFGRTKSNTHVDDVAEKRFEALRRWRNDLARTRGVRPFTILSNKTLRAIATNQPANETELIEIRGIGPVKLSQYGLAILERLRNFEDTFNEKSIADLK
jgi:ATP-dependent DNA helicase RecQ